MEIKYLLALVGALVLLAQSGAALNCYKCDSSDANCITNVTAVSTATGENCKFCITKLDDAGKITRDCAAETCTGERCKACTEELCNKNLICTKCNTSDVKCLEIGSADTSFNQICEASSTKCFVNIKDKTLERRCAVSDEKCENSETCQLCEGGNCNNKVFPSNRRRCFQCNESDCGVVLNKVEPSLCLDPKDDCYITGTDSTKMTRGCKSDNSKCTGNSSDCFTCSTDKCNDLEYEIKQPILCEQCNNADNKSDTSCSWSTGQPKDCNKPIKFNQKGMCYTVVKGDVVKRGCLYDDFTNVSDCKEADGCTTCDSGNGCNNLAADFTCIRCRSDMEDKCWNQADKLPGDECRNPVAQNQSDCFWGIWNKVLIRGCLVDADPRMQLVCNDKTDDQCATCTGKDCNTKAAGAAGITVATSLIALLVLTVSRM